MNSSAITSVQRRLRLAVQSGQLSHAYIIAGPRGGEQTSVAVWFAMLLLCENPVDSDKPCGHCDACRRLIAGNHPDATRIQPDGNTIKIQQIRDLQRLFSRAALESSHRVYLIEEADCLTPEAANSLLKFLEEPMIQSVAVLTTSRIEIMMPTIRSRCQLLSLGAPSPPQIAEQLQLQGIDDSKALIAAQLGGSTEAAMAFCQDDAFADLIDTVLQLSDEIVKEQGNPWELVSSRIVKAGWTASQNDVFLDLIALWCRDLLHHKLGVEDTTFRSYEDRLTSQLPAYDADRLVAVIRDCWETKGRLRANANVQMTLERLVLRWQGGVGKWSIRS